MAGGCLSSLPAQLPSLPSLQYRVLRAGRVFPFALSYQMTHVSRLPGLTMTLPELARAGFLSWTGKLSPPHVPGQLRATGKSQTLTQIHSLLARTPATHFLFSFIRSFSFLYFFFLSFLFFFLFSFIPFFISFFLFLFFSCSMKCSGLNS